MRVFVDCPMCGHKNTVNIETSFFRDFLRTCDSDDGGCGEDFVCRVTQTVTVKTAIISDFLTAEEHAHEKARNREA